MLDAGCGEGVLTREPISRQWDVYAFDVVDSFIDRLKSQWPALRDNFWTADILSNNFQERFDIVVANALLLVLADIDLGLKRLLSLVAPGGTLIIGDVCSRLHRSLGYYAKGQFVRVHDVNRILHFEKDVGGGQSVAIHNHHPPGFYRRTLETLGATCNSDDELLAVRSSIVQDSLLSLSDREAVLKRLEPDFVNPTFLTTCNDKNIVRLEFSCAGYDSLQLQSECASVNINLNGRIAIVTGAASDIGRAIVEALVSAGADQVVTARDSSRLSTVVESAAAVGRTAVALSCDLTAPDDPARVAEFAIRRFGRIDILVNAAGGRGPLETPIVEMSIDAFRETMDVNALGCLLMMQATIPHMIRQRYGKVVNIGGTFGVRGAAGRSAYSASKWALRGITKSAALELGAHNINVNNVSPGMVEGERFQAVCEARALQSGVTVDDAKRQIEGTYAMQRISLPQDVAYSVLFLASDWSRQITGHDLVVDGGSFI